MTHAINNGAAKEVNGTRTGTVKFFRERGGFGFIVPDGGGDELFFHVSCLVGDDEPLAKDRVSFVPGRGKDGRLRAEQVKILG